MLSMNEGIFEPQEVMVIVFIQFAIQLIESAKGEMLDDITLLNPGQTLPSYSD